MDKKGWMLLRLLINRFDPDASDALLQFLPQTDRDMLLAQDIHSNDLATILQEPERSIGKIHYSWFKPFLEQFNPTLQSVVISSFTSEQKAGFPNTSFKSISKPIKTFFLDKLYAQLKIDEHLPVEFIPETELTPLTTWTKQQLIHLIDFLGLHDLAPEVRHIVNRNQLNNIYSSLTPQQLHYLKICLHQKEKIVSPKLGIDLSKNDPDQLKHLLHRRGLARFGKAFFGQHPDLIWHIAHTLDSGRGKILLKDYQPNALPSITPVLKQQVLNIMNFLKSE